MMGSRILYISPFSPHQVTSASELRSIQIAQALREVGQVRVVVVGVKEGLQTASESGSGELDVAYSVSVQPRLNQSVVQKVNWALNARSACPHGMAVIDDDLERVERTAAEYDLVWFFKLRTANMFSRFTWPRSVVDVDDVPSTFEHSMLRTERSAGKRLSTSLRLWSWKRRERLLGERFSVIAVCSEADQAYLRSLGVKGSIRVIPNGYARPAVPPVRRLADPPRIGFIGIFDHGPNVAGIHWFARECWPKIKRESPNARLRLVGRFSDGALAPKGVDIDPLGWIEEPSDEIATWASMVVPLHVGAGTRGKIAHAFSQKCPIVSTALGAYGYDAIDGDNMFLAESAEAFADACLRTVRQPTVAAAVAERAWQQFVSKWAWDAIRPRVRDAVDDCLRTA
jgi:hypothetical protein